MFEKLFGKASKESEEKALERAKAEREERERQEAIQSAERASRGLSTGEHAAAKRRREAGKKEYPDTSPFAKGRM